MPTWTLSLAVCPGKEIVLITANSGISELQTLSREAAVVPTRERRRARTDDDLLLAGVGGCKECS